LSSKDNFTKKVALLQENETTFGEIKTDHGLIKTLDNFIQFYYIKCDFFLKKLA